MYYFSYGSNMSSRRILARVPTARKVSTAVLERHRLAFHKVSNNDATAKCDARETGLKEDRIHGVLFMISEQDKLILDRYEGLGRGYEEKIVRVVLTGGEVTEAVTYYATRIDPELKPLDWYKTHVLRGAREHGLPENYVQAIEAIEHIEDTNKKRRERELSIYWES
jgi:gamma-glutamylcyclotransferase